MVHRCSLPPVFCLPACIQVMKIYLHAGLSLSGISVTEQHKMHIIKKIETLGSTSRNVCNKLVEEAIKDKQFGVTPLFKFVFKIDVSFKAIVKVIDLPNEETVIMVSAIASHTEYLKSEAVCEKMLEPVRGVIADLVNTAMLEAKSQLIDLYLDRFSFEGVAIDIPFLLEKSDLCYQPHWLQNLFERGAKLQKCDRLSVKVVLQTKYEQRGVKLQMVKILVENKADVSFDIPDTTVIHEILKCIQCENGNADMLDLVCRKFEFKCHKVCDKEGKTPWHLALAGKRKIGVEICKILSKYPIDPSKKDKSGRRADYGMKDEDERVKILRNKRESIGKESTAGIVKNITKKKKTKKQKKNKEKPGEIESSERLSQVYWSKEIKNQGGNDELCETLYQLDIADDNEKIKDNLQLLEILSQSDVLNESENKGEINPVNTSGAIKINEESPDVVESGDDIDVLEANRSHKPQAAIGLEGFNSEMHHDDAENDEAKVSMAPMQKEHDPQSQKNTPDLDRCVEASPKACKTPASVEESTKDMIRGSLQKLHNHEYEYFCVETKNSKQTIVQNPAASNTVPANPQNSTRGAQTTEEKSSLKQSAERSLSQEESNHKHPLPEEGDEVEEYFENGVWDIECCKKVMQILSGKKHKHIKRLFLAKMEILSQGEFMGNSKHCKSVSSIKGVELYETRLNDKDRVIWQIVPQFYLDSGKDEYREIIRVWDIVLDHDNIHHHVEVIERNIHERACQVPDKLKVKLKSVSPNESNIHNNKRYPRVFTSCQDKLTKCNDDAVFYPPMDPERGSFCIAHLYSLSNCVVKLMLEDGDIERAFPYKEWRTEHDIINLQYKSAVLLLGRSGTGKTTCCLYRMWNEFASYWRLHADSAQLHSLPPTESQIDESDSPTIICASSDIERIFVNNDEQFKSKEKEICHLHQVFVTRNNVLCSSLKNQFLKFANSEEFTKSHAQRKGEKLPLTIDDIHDLSYPLFLTARQFYILLDYSLQDNNYFFRRDKQGKITETIVGTDYDHDDTLMYDLDDDDNVLSYQTSHTAYHDMRMRREVTASYFETKIWPQIKKGHDKMSPLLVWMEIKSFIKGSREAIECESGYLSEEEYNEIGRKAAPNFRGDRKRVYELFVLYKAYIQNHPTENLFDECDLVHNLFKRLPEGVDKLKWVLHSIYIDEVQDFTQGELWLMLHNCSDPNRVFLTGDTAQSIMSGIAFRFEDVKTLFHHLKLEVPKVRHLTINFRAHSGILRLASSVTDLLKCYFPNSFDHEGLQCEQGLQKGPNPVFIRPCTPTDLAMALAGNKQAKTIDFGANQAILVRNQEAKERLPEELKAAIVLTIFESKGLEFNDVILHNFFTDSKVCCTFCNHL